MKVYAEFLSENASLVLHSVQDQLLWRDGSAFPETIPCGTITSAHAWRHRLRQSVLGSCLGVGLIFAVAVSTWIFRRWIKMRWTRKITDDRHDLIPVETPFSKAVAVLQVVSRQAVIWFGLVFAGHNKSVLMKGAAFACRTLLILDSLSEGRRRSELRKLYSCYLHRMTYTPHS